MSISIRLKMFYADGVGITGCAIRCQQPVPVPQLQRVQRHQPVRQQRRPVPVRQPVHQRVRQQRYNYGKYNIFIGTRTKCISDRPDDADRAARRSILY